MDCGTVSRAIDAFREGALSEGEASDIRQHVAGCSACRKLLSAAEEFDKHLRDAMTSVRPPSDFAARTSRVVGDAAIEPASARPVVWVVTAAAACLALAVGVRYFTSRPRPGRERSESEVVSRAPSRGSGLGRAYVISEDGRLIAYTGRASIRKIWNMKEGVFELIVDAFPGEGSR